MIQPAQSGPPIDDLPAFHCQVTSRVGIVIAWVVVAACVALIVTLNQLESARRQSEPPDTLSPNVAMELTARYAVGFKGLIALSPQPPRGVDFAIKSLESLDTAAKTVPDKLRVDIVSGHLAGAPAALKRLKDLSPVLRSPSLEADATALHSIYAIGASSLSAKDRQRLISRYGWYGHLALGFEQPANNADRSLAMRGAWRAVAAIGVAVFIIFLALIAGLVLSIIALVKLADGKIHPAYLPVVASTGPFLEGFALYLALMLGVGMLVGRYSGHLNITATYLLAGLLPVIGGLAWPLLRGITWRELRYGLGWHAGTGVFREMFLGIVAYIAGLPLLAAAATITIVLSKISGANTTHPIVNEAAGFASGIRLLLLASVFAPLAEESLFRGALLHHLRSRHGWWISALIVSLIFASIHPQGWAAIPPLATIAMTLAAIRQWRGTIVASVAAHALNNGVLVLMLVIATS